MQVYFLLRCRRCKWWRKCPGLTKDLEDLVEIKKCKNCGGVRKFKCPKCAEMIKMMRVEKPDDDIQEK